MIAVLLALLAVGVVALYVLVKSRWPGLLRGSDPVTLPLPRGLHHMHYCTKCDRQWEHAGASHECTRSWAMSCPLCVASPTPA